MLTVQWHCWHVLHKVPWTVSQCSNPNHSPTFTFSYLLTFLNCQRYGPPCHPYSIPPKYIFSCHPQCQCLRTFHALKSATCSASLPYSAFILSINGAVQWKAAFPQCSLMDSYQISASHIFPSVIIHFAKPVARFFICYALLDVIPILVLIL